MKTTNFAKLGTATWRAEINRNDGDEPFAETMAMHEFAGARSKGIAKAWATRTAAGLPPVPPPRYEGGPEQHYWVRLARGTYQDESFPDWDRGGRIVRDAAWDIDHDWNGNNIELFAWVDGAGVAHWD